MMSIEEKKITIIKILEKIFFREMLRHPEIYDEIIKQNLDYNTLQNEIDNLFLRIPTYCDIFSRYVENLNFIKREIEIKDDNKDNSNYQKIIFEIDYFINNFNHLYSLKENDKNQYMIFHEVDFFKFHPEFKSIANEFIQKNKIFCFWDVAEKIKKISSDDNIIQMEKLSNPNINFPDEIKLLIGKQNLNKTLEIEFKEKYVFISHLITNIKKNDENSENLIWYLIFICYFSFNLNKISDILDSFQNSSGILKKFSFEDINFKKIISYDKIINKKIKLIDSILKKNILLFENETNLLNEFKQKLINELTEYKLIFEIDIFTSKNTISQTQVLSSYTELEKLKNFNLKFFNIEDLNIKILNYRAQMCFIPEENFITILKKNLKIIFEFYNEDIKNELQQIYKLTNSDILTDSEKIMNYLNLFRTLNPITDYSYIKTLYYKYQFKIIKIICEPFPSAINFEKAKPEIEKKIKWIDMLDFSDDKNLTSMDKALKDLAIKLSIINDSNFDENIQNANTGLFEIIAEFYELFEFRKMKVTNLTIKLHDEVIISELLNSGIKKIGKIDISLKMSPIEIQQLFETLKNDYFFKIFYNQNIFNSPVINIRNYNSKVACRNCCSLYQFKIN